VAGSGGMEPEVIHRIPSLTKHLRRGDDVAPRLGLLNPKEKHLRQPAGNLTTKTREEGPKKSTRAGETSTNGSYK